MSKRIYISADYSENSGDRNVVETLNKWAKDNRYLIDFVDMSKVVSGSVSEDSDCRICDLKAEFNKQINASSYVIIVVGDKTASRTAGNACLRNSKEWYECTCTPYKQNANGSKQCRVYSVFESSNGGDVGNINTYSYLRHEFEQAKQKGKNIIVVYNSSRKEESWLPWYMEEYANDAQPFWSIDLFGNKVGNYSFVKKALGYE